MFAGRRHKQQFAFFFAPLAVLLVLSSPAANAQMSAKGVVDLDGRAADPFRLAAGKVVVLVFTRTDCPISNRYAPAIQELTLRFGKGAEFFLVYPVRAETDEQVRNHLKEYGYKLTALRDPEYTLVRAGRARVTPEAAVFSPGGQLLYHGRIDDWYTEFGRSRPTPTTHELANAVQAAISGKPVSVSDQPAIGCFLPDRP